MKKHFRSLGPRMTRAPAHEVRAGLLMQIEAACCTLPRCGYCAEYPMWIAVLGLLQRNCTGHSEKQERAIPSMSRSITCFADCLGTSSHLSVKF